MSNFNASWTVLYTMPRHEVKVQKRLSEIGLISYLPTRKVLRRWNDRMKQISEPVFPSYLFTYIENVENYYDCLALNGTVGFVKIGNEVALVRDELINNLKITLNAFDDFKVCDGSSDKGQKLVIVKGSLAGLSCELVGTKDANRLLVRVELLNRAIILPIGIDSVSRSDFVLC